MDRGRSVDDSRMNDEAVESCGVDARDVIPLPAPEGSVIKTERIWLYEDDGFTVPVADILVGSCVAPEGRDIATDVDGIRAPVSSTMTIDLLPAVI